MLCPGKMDFLWKRAWVCQKSSNFRRSGIKTRNLYGLPEKIANNLNHCLFLGYEDNHPQDTFRVLDLKNKVTFTRNVRWLGKIYGKFFKFSAPNVKF